jgi:hypothetical protein
MLNNAIIPLFNIAEMMYVILTSNIRVNKLLDTPFINSDIKDKIIYFEE